MSVRHFQNINDILHRQNSTNSRVAQLLQVIEDVLVGDWEQFNCNLVKVVRGQARVEKLESKKVDVREDQKKEDVNGQNFDEDEKEKKEEDQNENKKEKE